MMNIELIEKQFRSRVAISTVIFLALLGCVESGRLNHAKTSQFQSINESEKNTLVLRNRNYSRFPRFILLNDSLISLDLSLNNIRHIPRGIDNLTKLEFLSLSSNPIKDIDNLTNIKSLKHLDLFETGLTKLPPSIINLENLEFLNLTNTLVHEIPPIMREMKKLQRLGLGGVYGHQFNEEEKEFIRDLLPNCKVSF